MSGLPLYNGDHGRVQRKTISMDLSGLLITAVGLTYIGALVYLANLVEASRMQRLAAPAFPRKSSALPAYADTTQVTILRWLLHGLIALIFAVGFMVMQLGLFSDIAAEQLPDAPQLNIDTTAAIVAFVLAVIASFISYRVVASEEVRQRLQRWIGTRGSYNPESSVHTVAVVLMLAIVVWTVAAFVSQGGISGLAAELETSAIDSGDLIFQAVLQMIVALLGVGLAIRRTAVETLERLGLRLPTRSDWMWGIGLGLVFIGAMVVFGLIWQGLVSPELLEEQTAAADQLAQSFTTLPLAFLLAASAALGEEILIRGAMQPVFGVFITSVFFTILHTQYTLTPATLIIFGVSLGLGWLRSRHSTTAAIIAHFVYNFVPLALASSLI